MMDRKPSCIDNGASSDEKQSPALEDLAGLRALAHKAGR